MFLFKQEMLPKIYEYGKLGESTILYNLHFLRFSLVSKLEQIDFQIPEYEVSQL